MKDTYKEIARSVPNSGCAFKYILLSRGVDLPTWKSERNSLLFVVEGKIKMTGTDGAVRSIPGGNFALIPKTENWKGVAMQDTRMVIFLFNRVDHVWTSNKIKKLMAAAEGKTRENYMTLPVERPLGVFLELMAWYTEEKEIDRSFYVAKDSELLSLLYAFYPADELGCMFYPLLHRNLDFKSFVEANYMKVESAVDLARLMGCSMVTLNRKFKEYYQDTAYQWILKNKTALIRKRIRDSSGLLSEIAKEFGFYSGSELNRFCQRQFGVSALKMRKGAAGGRRGNEALSGRRMNGKA